MLKNYSRQLFGRYISNERITIEKCNSEEDIKNKLIEFQRSLYENEWFSNITYDDDKYNDLINKDKKELHADESLFLKLHITKGLLNSIINTYDSYGDNSVCFFGYIGSRGQKKLIIGVMNILVKSSREPTYPVVDNLVIHPGIQNCGHLFLEEAVNYSYSIKQKGNLKLSVAANSLKNVYEKIGFTELNEIGEMVLVPKDRADWIYSSSLDKYMFIKKA